VVSPANLIKGPDQFISCQYPEERLIYIYRSTIIPQALKIALVILN